MQRLIDDLLAYSRVVSRSAPFAPADLNKVFEDAVLLHLASIEDASGEVTRDDLPTVAVIARKCPNCCKTCSATPLSTTAINHRKSTCQRNTPLTNTPVPASAWPSAAASSSSMAATFGWNQRRGTGAPFTSPSRTEAAKLQRDPS